MLCLRWFAACSIIFIIYCIAFFHTTFYAVPPIAPHSPFSIDIGNGLVFHATHPNNLGHGYPVTGVYRMGELVYAVEHHPPIWEGLYFSYDGMSFIQICVLHLHWHGRPPRLRDIEPGHTVVRFFYRGEITHTFSWDDLLKWRNSIFITGIVTAEWDYWGKRQHNRRENTLQIITRDMRRITFDLSTGLIVHETRYFNMWALLPALCCIFIGGVYLICKRTQKNRRPGSRRFFY